LKTIALADSSFKEIPFDRSMEELLWNGDNNPRGLFPFEITEPKARYVSISAFFQQLGNTHPAAEPFPLGKGMSGLGGHKLFILCEIILDSFSH
jgi:hypothetical protein